MRCCSVFLTTFIFFICYAFTLAFLTTTIYVFNNASSLALAVRLSLVFNNRVFERAQQKERSRPPC